MVWGGGKGVGAEYSIKIVEGREPMKETPDGSK